MWSSLRRFSEFLALAIAHAPATAEIDESTRDISRWGGVMVEQRVQRQKGLVPSATHYIEAARFHRARLHSAKALKAITRATELQPDNAEALELKFQLLAESGARYPKLVAAAEEASARFPLDARFRTRVFALKLAERDARVLPEAEHALAREPDNFELGMALADYFFRTKNYDRAIEITDGFAQRPSDEGQRRAASLARDYFRRYAESGAFRAQEKVKYWGRIALAVLPFMIFFAAKFWGSYGGREVPAPEHTSEDVQRLTERIATQQKEVKEVSERVARAKEVHAGLRVKAEEGDPAAQYELAGNLFRGHRGEPKNPEEAKRYLELASAQDYLPAMEDLADRLRLGRGMVVDHTQAVGWLEKAVELGSSNAAAQLGSYYSKGEHVANDEPRAFVLFQKAAAGGNSWAETLVGWSLAGGRGVEKNLELALVSYRRAAEAGERWAHEQLARLLSDRNSPHRDLAEAEKWSFAGARLGSETLRASWYSRLQARVFATDEQTEEAIRWLEDDAKKEVVSAQYYLAEAYWTGWHRTQNLAEAVRLYGLAAEKDYPPALASYARCLAAGVGVEQDLVRARAMRAKLDEFKAPASVTSQVDAVIDGWAQAVDAEMLKADARPRVVFQTAPEFPRAMAASGIGGEVSLELRIDAEGRVRDVEILQSTHDQYAAAARAAVVFWRFTPFEMAKSSQEAKGVRVRQVLEFNLSNERRSRSANQSVEAVLSP